MRERRAVLLLVTGLALAAGLGLALDIGPPLGLTMLALTGVVLALAAQQWMSRLPSDDEP